MGKVLDDPGIGIGDDEDSQGHCHGKKKRQIGMGAKRFEGLLRAIGGGGEPVRAQPDPCQERDKRHLVKQVWVFQMLRSAKNRLENPPEPVAFSSV